jgi:regulator of sigma E protease
MITTVLAFIVALGVLITVHEYGHFWVARKLGVKVLRFSVGFGRPLWRRVGRDGVEYVVAAIPLGGYVKMLDEREAPVDSSQRPMAFNNKPLSTRTSVVAAGPAANLLFAIFAYWLVFMIGDLGMRPMVGGVESGSAAEAIGLKPGDELKAVNGDKTPTWEKALFALVQASIDGGPATLLVEDKNGEIRTLRSPSGAFSELAQDDQGLESVGITQARPQLPPVVGELIAGEAAEQAGLIAGDKVLTVNGETVADWSGFVEIIQASANISLQLQIEREGQVLPL